MFLKTDSIKMAAETSDFEPLATALDQLLEGDFQTRWEATKRIAMAGTAAIAHLIPLLEDEDLDWEVRWFAARTLSTFEDTAALDALIRLLQRTQEPELIAIAAEGLSQFEDQGVNALIALLDTPTYRLTAIQALANIRHRTVLVPLLAASEDANPAVRKTAIAALGNFREPQVDEVLIQAVKDPAVAVRQEAIACLGLRSNLLEQVNLVDVLLPGLWDLHPEVNKATAIALGRLGTETAVSSLARVLRSPHTPTDMQIQIVRALGWSEKESAFRALLSMRQSAQLAVQVEIVAILSRLQAPLLRQQASAMLLDWLQSLLSTTEGAPDLKQAIALALANLNMQSARPWLEAMSQDTDAQTGLYAEAALRQLAAASSV